MARFWICRMICRSVLVFLFSVNFVFFTLCLLLVVLRLQISRQNEGPPSSKDCLIGNVRRQSTMWKTSKMDGWIGGRIDGWIDGRINGRIGGRIGGWIDGRINILCRSTDRWMDRWHFVVDTEILYTGVYGRGGTRGTCPPGNSHA